MNQAPLLEIAERTLRQASWENWTRIVTTLQAREIEMFRLVCRYLRSTGYENVTGGELAAWSGVSILHVRPRLTGLVKKGWLFSGEMRASRVVDEARCHPVWPAVPEAAIERISQ